MRIIKNLPLPSKETNSQVSAPGPLLSDQKPKKNWMREYAYLLLCMLVPAAVMYLIYLARGIYPFGNGTVLVLDLNGQYVWFFEALRKCVYGDASLLYSFCRALGGEFLGIYAYYLASPLSYIVCLFPESMMQEALLTLFILKTAICGGTFGFYMHRTLQNPKPYAIISFATFYAVTSYAVVQQNNTMWIDAMMWLPLLTLGIEQLIKYGKFKMYTIFLALILFSNFYIGFMACIYTFVYFFLYYVAHSGNHRNNPNRESAHFIKSLFRIAFYSLLAIGIAGVILLGAYYALNFGKTTFSNPKWVWSFKLDALDLLYKFLPGSYDTVRPDGHPFVYCGVLTLLLIPAYFFNKKYPVRQKIISAVFILFFIASFSLSVLDLIWHCFQKPNWLNYRYSFMLCFYLCVLACRAFAELESTLLRIVIATGGLLAFLCTNLQNYTSGKYVKPDDLTCILFTLIMIFVYIVILGLLKIGNGKRVLSFLLLVIICAETFLNGLWNMNAFGDDVGFSTHSRYQDFLAKTRPIVQMVQESDTSFYRMEKTFFRKTNDNMALNMYGLSGSTSTLNKETIQFLNKMGYSSKSHWSKYLGGTPVNDSLLGLKYIISNDTKFATYYEPYKVDTSNNYTAYYNPYALSLAYGVDEDLLDFPLGYLPVEKDEEDEKKTSVISDAINAVKGAINNILGIDETVNSAEYEDKYDSPFERLNAIVTAMLGEEDTVEIFVPIRIQNEYTSNTDKAYVVGHYRYEPVDSSLDATVSYEVEMPLDAELFFYMPSDYPREVKLTLIENGSGVSKGTFHGNETSRIISLGMQSEGDLLSLRMTMTTPYLYPMMGEEYFYYIDWEVFEDAMARLAQDQYQITEFSETSFDGTFTASREHELVMTTLAYDKGWKVTVDGKEVETVKVLGSLVAFYVDGEAGDTHRIEMVYSPNTLHVGTIISLISLSVLILLIIFEKAMKKHRILPSLVGVPPLRRSIFDLAEEAEKAKLEAAQQKNNPTGASSAPSDATAETGNDENGGDKKADPSQNE
ncbi:MAG: hypothetical protein E7666_00135 [Ruminococcaceae bacterium]|nr:hypothetical protein [Oscillospiraceae bacterium]